MTGSTQRFSCAIFCTNRAMRSLPPPAALGTTISTRLSGFQSAALQSVVAAATSITRTEHSAGNCVFDDILGQSIDVILSVRMYQQCTRDDTQIEDVNKIFRAKPQAHCAIAFCEWARQDARIAFSSVSLAP